MLLAAGLVLLVIRDDLCAVASAWRPLEPRSPRAAQNPGSPPWKVALGATLEVATALIIGAIVTRQGIISSEVLRALSKAVVGVFLPLFLCTGVGKSVSTAIHTGRTGWLLLLPGSAVCHSALGLVSAMLTCRALGMSMTAPESKLLCVLSAWGNCAMPVLFAQSLFRDQPGLLGRVSSGVSLYLLGWNLSFWSLGYALVESASQEAAGPAKTEDSPEPPGKGASGLQRVILRVLSVPPVLGAVCGLIIGLTPFLRDPLVPIAGTPPKFLEPLFRAAESMGAAAIPCSQLVLAGSLADTGAGDFSGLDSLLVPAKVASRRGLAVVGFVRLIVLPVVAGLGLVHILKQNGMLENLSTSAKAVLYIMLSETSMPSAQNAVLIPRLVGRPDLSIAMARLSVGVYILTMSAMCFWLTCWLDVAAV